MDDVTLALHRIARGTGIVFIGTLISMFFGFLSRTIIARHFSPIEYGTFNLAITVLNIGVVIATLGFQNALPREIAFYREKEPSRIKDLISTALIIVSLNSLIWGVVLTIGAGKISQILNEPRLNYALRTVALALPFSALTITMISISRGFGRVREKVYFQNIVYPTSWLILVILSVLFNLSFALTFYMYLLAQLLTFLALTAEVYRIKLLNFKLSFNLRIGKELIIFSLPLLFTGILAFVMNWTDTLMLGYYKGSEIVGIYNAASPLARLIPIFLNSATFLYPAIVSQLYAQGKISEMKRVYQILTKWIFLLTLPVFSVMFLFPEATIRFFFGNKYVSATSALRILALGFMFHTFLGLNGLSLIVIGESGFIMISNLISTILNIFMNILLIPKYSIEGAAIATAISYFIGNVLNSVRLYQETKIHPFSWNYVKPLAISFILLGLIQSLHLKVPSIWHAVPILVMFLGVYFFLVLLSKSVDREDVELLLAIEKKLGIDLKIMKKILRRFIF
ncbi:flippase [Pyrococcus sp. ST04]|uniref:flippase n=1 Tax=Pyrococcus sp. ST04 TaxID=1183377 RepID=UPI0002605A82|nr:flippase [Pyrococcus sp. ST04]AFK22067.1 putative polysaccharide biosynthesis-like protein [Pyrococcus sp. ST04]